MLRHGGTLSAEEIGKSLSKNPKAIQKFLTANIDAVDSHGDPEAARAWRQGIKASPEWKLLKDELMTDELRYFEHRYAKLMSQFQEDVTPSEETHVFMLIKYEILMNRNMKDRKRSAFDVERLEKLEKGIYEQFPDVVTMDVSTKQLLMNIQNQLLGARSAEHSKSAEYMKLTEKHSDLMKILKATREQRINKASDNNVTFLDIVKNLQEEDIREREGRLLGLVQLSTAKQAAALGSYHTYDDGVVDRPLLSAETVKGE